MNRYDRVLLIKFYTKVGYGARRPPTGLGYIAEALHRREIPYEIVDCDLGYGLDEIIDRIHTLKPNLIGISMVTLGYLNSYEMIRVIKKAASCDIILGGPHISTLRTKVLEDCDSIDFGVVGEGDRLIVDLCEGAPLEGIPGLIYRENNRIRFTGTCKPIIDIDTFGFPKYPGFELEKYFGYGSEIGVVTSRGCPYGCTFCAVRLIMGRRIRLRTADNVAEEFQYWTEKGYKRLVVLDDNFSHDRQRVFDICDSIEERDLTGIQISLANGLRADRTDPEMLMRLRDVGAYEIQIGVESASDRVLKIIRKGETLETIEKAIQDSIRTGYEVGANFLIGSPGERWEDVQDSFDFAQRYPLGRAFFFNIIPYPGTPIFEELESKGYLRATPDEYLGSLRQNENTPVFETPELSLADRRRLIHQAQRVSEKVRRRFLEGKFSKFRFLAKPMAFLSAWHVSEPILKRNKLVNKYLLPLYYNTLKKKSMF
jgi:anaerobic magnesium-protoporphyrin IX monomethyl ester cyclase